MSGLTVVGQVTQRAPNPVFGSTSATATSAVTVGTGTISYATDWFETGTRSLKFVRNSSSPNATIASLRLVPTSPTGGDAALSVPVTPGETISVGMRVRTSVAARPRVQVVWMDAAGATAGFTTSTSPLGTQPTTANTPRDVIFEAVVVPAGAAFAQVRALVQTSSGNTVGGETAWVDHWWVFGGAFAGAFFYGSSASTSLVKHRWAGAKHASVSVQTTYSNQPVTYQSIVAPHARRDEGWRYFAVRMDGEGGYTNVDGDVPLRGVSITDVLSGPNALSGTLEPEFARFTDNQGRPIFRPWETAIFAEREGTIYGGGLLLPSSFSDSTWNIECVGFTGYWAGQAFTDSEFLVEVDPIDVIRRIYEWMQDQPGANLGLEIDDTLSGQKIGVELEQIEYDTENGPLAFEAGPIKLNWYDTHDLGGMVDEFAKNTPCDYHERHWWDGDTLRHKVDIAYPRMGRRRRDLRFVIGENIAAIPSVDAGLESQYATHVLALGAGEGRTMKYALKAKTRFRGLRRVAIVEDKAMNSVAKVNKFAQRELDRLKGLGSVREVVVRNSENAKQGDWQVGDEILVQGDAGWQQLETWCRIVSSSISPEDSDNSVLTVVSQGQEEQEATE